MQEANPVIAMTDASDLAALLDLVEVAASGPDPAAKAAERAFVRLVAQAHAGRVLAGDVCGMITDLFGGSDPRKVGEAARAALAYYSIARGTGIGSELLRTTRRQREHAS